MEPPNVRETRQRGEREHNETDGPFTADENPERILEEEVLENAESDKEEKLSANTMNAHIGLRHLILLPCRISEVFASTLKE